MCSWWYFETSADLLLIRFTDEVKIWYFSLKHKLYFLDTFWHGLTWSITDQCMIGFSMPFLFISQKCSGNCIEFVLLSHLKELRCLQIIFNDWFYKHWNSFRYDSKDDSADLSKHFREIKRKGIEEPIMRWSVIDRAKLCQNGSKSWNLCFTQKCHILTSPINLIGKRSEIVSKCRHENQFHLVNYKAIPPDN